LPAKLAASIAELMTTTYAGFNDVPLTEKLREVHRLEVCRESVRRIRLGLGRPADRCQAALYFFLVTSSIRWRTSLNS